MNSLKIGDKKRTQPPVLVLLIMFLTLFSLISVGVTLIFNFPWHFPFPHFLGIIIGLILLAFGFFILINALRTLKLKRAFGKEINKPNKECKLITSGIYAFTRNPLYLGASFMFCGWFFIFLYTFLLILTLLFLALFYFVAKWEEKELFERFGEDYFQYKKRVAFFIPNIRNTNRN